MLPHFRLRTSGVLDTRQGNRISFRARRFSGSSKHAPTFLTLIADCTEATPTGLQSTTVQADVSQVTRAKCRRICGTPSEMRLPWDTRVRI
jgi:hypothetical protein